MIGSQSGSVILRNQNVPFFQLCHLGVVAKYLGGSRANPRAYAPAFAEGNTRFV